ncbi:hypothetical protein BU16DRAFT_540107 [Lophium mytilinum]|uniref:Uncharacterized protein n=1 Tax=Lophium mytilinum TaxID=390894 RepID=A0A6A6QVC7_9PEZI|nr:hypothetical protein BU16DRAFT_540107 [Lophium mytilinum]
MASQNPHIKQEDDVQSAHSDSVFSVPYEDIDDETWQALLAAESSEPEPEWEEEVAEPSGGEAEGSSHAQPQSSNAAPGASGTPTPGMEESVTSTLERIQKRAIAEDSSDDESDQSPLKRRSPNPTKRRRTMGGMRAEEEGRARLADPPRRVGYPSLPTSEEGPGGAAWRENLEESPERSSEESPEQSSEESSWDSTTGSEGAAVQTSTPPVVLQPPGATLTGVPNGAPPGLTLVGSIDAALLLPGLGTHRAINLYVRDADLGGPAPGGYTSILQALARFLRLPGGG